MLVAEAVISRVPAEKESSDVTVAPVEAEAKTSSSQSQCRCHLDQPNIPKAMRLPDNLNLSSVTIVVTSEKTIGLQGEI